MAHETSLPPGPARQVTHLPLLATGPADINRLSRELALLDDTLLELGLRQGGQGVKLPKTSKLMDQLIELNQLQLLHEGDRRLLKQFLDAVRDRAPVLHMSFSADPSTAFLEKLLSWLRREIHPQALVTIGLQPTLGAGCILRTTNRRFDFSLRQDFATKRNLLLEKLIPATPRKADEQQ